MEHTYKVEQRAAHRFLITYDQPNSKGEQVAIELMLCSGDDSKHSLPYLWYKNGFTDHILKSYWYIETYVTKADGSCWGIYNPQDVKGKLDFDWMLDGTEENKEKILREFERRAYGE